LTKKLLVYRNFLATSPHVPIDLPPLAQEVCRHFDARVDGFVRYDEPRRHANEYDYLSGHMVYDKGQDRHFIETMAERFRARSGIPLEYQPGVFARYRGNGASCREMRRPYVLLQACTKRKYRAKTWKDYGFDNMLAIAERLSGHIAVVQIGAAGDLTLPDGIAEKRLSLGLHQLHGLMENAAGFIGMDGALGVYAGHHAFNHYIIYAVPEVHFEWCLFPNRMQIDGNVLNAEEVADLILGDLAQQGIIGTYDAKAVRKDACAAGRGGRGNRPAYRRCPAGYGRVY
jgi:hypothetical protein